MKSKAPKKTKKYVAKKALKNKKAPVSKSVNKLIPSSGNTNERKFIDTFKDDTIITNTGSLVLLNGVAQGTTASTRIGDKIKLKSLDIKIRLYQPQLDSSTVRYCIFIDTMANGVAPSILELFEYAGTIGNYSWISQRNKQYLRRFICLKDEVMSLNNSNTGANVVTEYHKEHYLKLNLDTDYGLGGGATIASIAQNSMYIIFLTAKASASTNPVYQLTARVRYTDD